MRKCFLFVHGAPGEGGDFKHILPTLKAKFGDDIVCWTPTLHGDKNEISQQDDTSSLNHLWRYSSESLLATSLWEAWDDFSSQFAQNSSSGLDSGLQLIVCGHSAGAPIAWEMVLQRPGLVSGLVLLCSPGARPHSTVNNRLVWWVHQLSAWGFYPAMYLQKKAAESRGMLPGSQNLSAIAARVCAYIWPRHEEVLRKRLGKVRHLRVLHVIPDKDKVVQSDVQMQANELLRSDPSFKASEELSGGHKGGRRLFTVLLKDGDHAAPLRRQYVQQWVDALEEMIQEAPPAPWSCL